MQEKKPMIIVFAGPNGSGKSTIKKLVNTNNLYINADEIKKVNDYSDLEAAQIAEKMREEALAEKKDFSFETVLSTDRNLKLLQRAKESGYFIKCFYILTNDPNVNLMRIKAREEKGGHGVPEEKIFSRYYKALKLLPELIKTVDIIHIYDNTIEPFRIFKKKFVEKLYWENSYWSKEKIIELTSVGLKK